MAFPRRGVVAGELVDQALVEEKRKELGLGHVRSRFEVLEPTFAKFIDHVGLVVFEHDQIHDMTSENGCGKGEHEAVQTGVRPLAHVPLRGGPGA